MKVKEPGLQYYVDRIIAGEPYTFVRYGDGEWTAAITRDRKYTGSDSQNIAISGLQREMRRSLASCHVTDNYIPSLRPSSLKPQVKKWLEQNIPEGVRWHDCRVFYRSSKHGRLFPLVETLRDLKVPLVFVGPARLRKLKERGIFPKASFIVIPGRNCYQGQSAIIQEILTAPRPAFISFTAGPAAKIMIHKLFRTLGDSSFLFDFGSLWDVYAGKRTRRYHRKMTPDIIRRNLTGK